jgi:hypothetical protein
VLVWWPQLQQGTKQRQFPQQLCSCHLEAAAQHSARVEPCQTNAAGAAVPGIPGVPGCYRVLQLLLSWAAWTLLTATCSVDSLAACCDFVC